MADQCIVCLESLDVQSSPHARSPLDSTAQDRRSSASDATPPTATPDGITPKSPRSPFNTAHNNSSHDNDSKIAAIQICGHVLHDSCLREWTGKANSCPICRQAFHLVHVYDKVGGTELFSYKVEDKKQVAEFDPQAWLDDNPEEEEEIRPCPICSQADHEDLLLLCDNCDAPYHTYCVGLDNVPRGHWFCVECSETAIDLLAAEIDEDDVTGGLAGLSNGRSDYLPRTQASMRRARQRARSDEWRGAWGEITGHVWDALEIDLDNHDDDDESLANYRRSQQRRERERRDYQRWQQRLNIASRLGARDVFSSNLPRRVAQQQQPPPPPPPPPETREEKQAWGALEKAIVADLPNRPTSNRNKRKSRSITASPVEPPLPERKLKRPRTRRVPQQPEASSSSSSTAVPDTVVRFDTSPNGSEAPSFLSSLLREVHTSRPTDDENLPSFVNVPKPVADPSSPATSPSPSAHSSPRALSITPPPRGINERSGSPLSLSSRIEPIYPPANYVTSRSGSDTSDSESRPRRKQHQHQQNGSLRSPEIRQPQPRRQPRINISANLTRSQDTSPTRTTLPFQMKESISGIVKDALKPHWKSGQLTADQYASINRDLSHKLYEEVTETALDEIAKTRFEKIATQEVARAVAELRV